MLTKLITQRILFGMYITAVIISLQVCDVKIRSLGFHHIDYSFYLEFSSKLLDGTKPQTYSINPDGKNWFFMRGVEGIRELQQNLHFEPIKYLYSVLYKTFNTPYALFIFIALVFFIPLPYLAYAMPLNTQLEMRNVLLLGTLYLLPPSVFLSPAFDLRPYIFLAPFFFLAVISIQVSRPIWEQIVWFNSMFLAREEAIILGAVLLLFSIVNKRTRRIQPIVFFALSVSYGIWILLTAAYMRWADYPVKFERIPDFLVNIFERLNRLEPLEIMGLIAGSAMAFLILWRVWNIFNNSRYFHATLDILIIGSVFFPLGYQLFTGYISSRLMTYFFTPRYYLHYIALILFIAVFFGHIKPNINMETWLGFVVLLMTVIILLNTVSSFGALKTSANFSQGIHSANAIWSFKKSLNPKKSIVLTDYSTHQAFYNFDHAYAYNRLPWSMLSGDKRLYPYNAEMVQSLIEEQIDYIIISRISINDIENILAGSSIQTKVIFENEDYIGLEIIRKQAESSP